MSSEHTQAYKVSKGWPSGDAKPYTRACLSEDPDSRGISLEWTLLIKSSLRCYHKQSQYEILFINTSHSEIKPSILLSLPPIFPNTNRNKLSHIVTSLLLISHLSLFQDNLHPILKCAQTTFYLKWFFSVPGIFY